MTDHELTCNLLEEIRQLEREIALVQDRCDENAFALAVVHLPQPCRVVRDIATWSRIISRLEAIRADIKQGMKEVS
jgi:hypothetical protein